MGKRMTDYQIKQTNYERENLQITHQSERERERESTKITDSCNPANNHVSQDIINLTGF